MWGLMHEVRASNVHTNLLRRDAGAYEELTPMQLAQERGLTIDYGQSCTTMITRDR